ncbi:alkaline phosphatase family protein [Brucepastera parasyntrophica]|uniref:alkaline phosphatase family protein n=1 Tax=Brucepastera parasyntrophica TaxID=2880008 RepID=UPI00210CC233|nr:alkaline phosphatase family protein [Brucepastera parasyntrophica]ULQ60772.1 alkaline phosphatase family protein [Brucepastera parasyntrophica]
MGRIVFPDYSNSILNLVSSILGYYNVPANYHELDVLTQYLEKRRKNIVLMIFDGMGADMLAKNALPSGFLLNHAIKRITSVFPPTTVAATMSYYSGLSPNEHGWLGWSLFSGNTAEQ